MERTWAFVAALSWYMVATVCLFVGILSAVFIITVPISVAILLAGTVAPFLIGRGIIVRSGLAAAGGVVYSLSMFIYSVIALPGLSNAGVLLLWLALVSALAAWEMRQRAA